MNCWTGLATHVGSPKICEATLDEVGSKSKTMATFEMLDTLDHHIQDFIQNFIFGHAWKVLKDFLNVSLSRNY